MTGSGTYNSPYIVESWAKFLSVCTQANKYIKFSGSGGTGYDDRGGFDLYVGKICQMNSLYNNVLPYTIFMPVEPPNGAFKDLSQLEEIHIPENVKEIGSHSFAGTSLTSVKITPTVRIQTRLFRLAALLNFTALDYEKM